MRNGTWYNCNQPKKDWLNGEYLIEKAPKARIVIWVNNQAGVTGIKTLKEAFKILTNEFEKVEKIER